MFYIEVFDSFNYEYALCAGIQDRSEAEAYLKHLQSEDRKRNGRNNSIGNRYTMTQNYYDLHCDVFNLPSQYWDFLEQKVDEWRKSRPVGTHFT